MQKFVFVNRRRGSDRRDDNDPCRNMPLDLFHRKRRKTGERRHPSRSLSDDYYAYMQKALDVVQPELVETRKPTN
ncbi:hypothetical protein TDB9533_04403 [Thalassocella blandensis]|nr:hypothetical protein TDB9533_04403 [Thalassocella blandensis]